MRNTKRIIAVLICFILSITLLTVANYAITPNSNLATMKTACGIVSTERSGIFDLGAEEQGDAAMLRAKQAYENRGIV